MRSFCFLLFLILGCFLHAQETPLLSFQKVNVSTKYFSEYNFITTKNGAFFVSDYATVTSKKVVDNENNNLSSIYFCPKRKKKYGNPKLVDIDFHNHIGSFYVNPDGDNILFTGRQTETATTFGIFKTEKIRGLWTKPVLIIKNMEQFNFVDPFVSAGGDTLYFSSDMPGGKGGLDLYLAKDFTSEWIRYENLGNSINSEKNERYPAIYNSTFYFSSNRENGIGGFDIYSTAFVGGKFEKNSLFSPPINSSEDDFIVDFEGNSMFFSSNRDGSDDIYELTTNFPNFECIPFEPLSRCYEFNDEFSRLQDTVQYTYLWTMGDGTEYSEIAVDHCFKNAGLFVVKLKITDSNTKDLISNETSYELEIIDPVQLELVIPDEISAGNTVEFNVSDELKVDSSIYYWDFGDGNFTRGETVSHKYPKNGIYQISVGRVYFIQGKEYRICTSKEVIIN